MSIKELLEALDKPEVKETKETFTQDELTPVHINPKSGKSAQLPPQKGGKQIDVEVIGDPPPESEADDDKPSKGKPKPGEGKPGKEGEPGKEIKKTDKPGEGKSKSPRTIDSHEILNKSNKDEVKEMAEKILEKAEHTRKERGDDPESGAGTGAGGFMEKLRGIHKPRINWVKELRKKLTDFKSQTSAAVNKLSRKPSERYRPGEGVQKSKAYHQWLKDPRSHAPDSKILFKGPYVKAPISEIILIVALDTSGSISATTITKVFTEMDKIARAFSSGISHAGVRLEGKVYLMTWDSVVQQVEEYKAGGWKKYMPSGEKTIKGRGGTEPDSIFKYMHDHFLFDKEKPSAGLLNLLGKPKSIGMSKDDIVIPIKGGESSPSAVIAPFLLIATDGEFYGGAVNDSDLGILYKDNKEKILYLVIDGTTEHCYPKNVIEYESYRV